jgi:hypothetical protein
MLKNEWPKNPKLWERFAYLCPISGVDWVTWEWCGVAGWRYVGRL